MRAMVLILLLGATACAPASEAGAPPPDQPQREREALPAPRNAPLSITYAAGPCYGTCPVYRFTVRADGSGEWVGEAHVAALGRRAMRVEPAAFDAFRDRLAPHRPRGERRIERGTPDCRQPMTDLPSITVTWQEGARRDELYFYAGCATLGHEALADALSEAPDSLPIMPLIRAR